MTFPSIWVLVSSALELFWPAVWECTLQEPMFSRLIQVWKASLPSLPVGDISWDAIRPSNVAVVGTKIFVTLRTRYETEGRLLFFDVADPKATWSNREPRIRDEMGVFHAMYNKVLVVDSEEEEDEKLIFTFDDEQIIVSAWCCPLKVKLIVLNE
ncbi:hypothetical protein ACLB2K_059403 [Fragaria x ananassa]